MTVIKRDGRVEKFDMKKIEIVTKSGYMAAKQILKAEEKPQKITKIQIFTAVCSTAAIIISITVMLLRLLR